MALGRKCSEPRLVVLEFDPALDLENSDYENYMESLFDEKHLKFFDGLEPTRFMIKQLTNNQKTFIAGLSNDREQAYWAVKFGHTSVKNYHIEKNGTSYPVDRVEFESAGKLGEVIKDKWFDDAGYTSDILWTLSALIHYFSEAKLPLSKPSLAPRGQ